MMEKSSYEYGSVLDQQKGHCTPQLDSSRIKNKDIYLSRTDP